MVRLRRDARRRTEGVRIDVPEGIVKLKSSSAEWSPPDIEKTITESASASLYAVRIGRIFSRAQVRSSSPAALSMAE